MDLCLSLSLSLSLSLFGINGREREQVMIDDQTGHHFSTDPVSMIAEEFYYLFSVLLRRSIQTMKSSHWYAPIYHLPMDDVNYGNCVTGGGGGGRYIRIIGYDSIKRYQLIALRHGAHT